MTNSTSYKLVEKRSFRKICRIFFLFFLGDTLNSFILLLKKNRKYHFDNSKYIGINLGSSTDNPPRWIGLSGGVTIFFVNLPKFLLYLAFPFSLRSKKQSFSDFYKEVKTGKVIHHNLFYGIPFKNDTVQNVFSSHFVEHLTYDSASFLMAESFRVLQPGGFIRILVPSLQSEVEKMKQAIEEFEKGNNQPIQTFVTEPYQDLMDSFSHHHFMYDGSALQKIISQVGFTEVEIKQLGEGKFPDLNLLEKRKSVIVEAKKPL